ncbi:MAG: hypothetical protein U0900_06625 [Myxococcota bacterium]
MNKTKLARADTAASTEITRFNAVRHGILSQYTVLPWEDPEEYRELVSALVLEHAPEGPTEGHLVEELAGILWRKRRLRLAEAAAFRRALDDTMSSCRDTSKVALAHIRTLDRDEDAGVVDAVRATAADTANDMRDMEEDEAMTRHALEVLRSDRTDRYEAALEILRDDTREWWGDALARGPGDLDEGEEPATPNEDGLELFLETTILPWFARRKDALAHRPLVREQAFGEALDPDRLDRLARYEVHLDRKFERILAMLLRLKSLRGAEGIS